eukprot:TRINITY_DN45623_c0_g1_i1.p1 TRINITY_DN45623_c0_g1~~TRINITY_DN45623_c0_g1_i1.p1  ORF type:complete len:485 (+),score=41.45 TRINITY_DN45623_c0_g1_i1:128-1456(+)
MVGRLNDTNALAALALCNVFCNISGFSWIQGLTTAISTLSSQAWGAGSHRAVGENLQRGVLISLTFAALPLCVLWLSSASLLDILGQSHEVADLVGLYTVIRSPGIFCEVVTAAVTKTLASIGNTRIQMYSSGLAALTTVSLNLFLIPRFGFVGAPITVLVTDVFQAITTCALAWQDTDFRKCWPGSLSKRAWKDWGMYLKFACPSLWLQNIEWWTWDLQSFLAGFISVEAQATQAMAPQITDVQYAVGAALSLSGSTVVGNLLGEGRPEVARRASFLIMRVVVAIMLLQLSVFWCFRLEVTHLFTRNQDIVSAIVNLFPLTLAFSFVDGHQAALTGILTGAGKQMVAAPIILFCYWILGVPLGICLAFGIFGGPPWGLEGLWTGMVVAVLCHCCAFYVCVRRLDWEQVAAEAQERESQKELERQRSGSSISATNLSSSLLG